MQSILVQEITLFITKLHCVISQVPSTTIWMEIRNAKKGEKCIVRIQMKTTTIRQELKTWHRYEGRRRWHPTPVLLPGKSHARRSLVAAVHGVARSRTRLSDFTFTFHFHALEKETATHSSVLAWRIPGMGEPGGLPSLGSHRVWHDRSDLAAAAETEITIGFIKCLITFLVMCPHNSMCTLQYFKGKKVNTSCGMERKK